MQLHQRACQLPCSRTGASRAPRVLAPCLAPQHQQRLPLLPRPQQAASRRSNTATNATSSSSSGGSSTFAERAQRFADSTQQKMQDFVKQQRLDDKAAEASKAAQEKLKELSQETQQNVRRTYMKLESEHNISQRLKRTQTWVAEKARDIDQEWSVRRRLRSTVEDVQRMAPQWRRQLSEFSATPLGKGSLTLLFVALLFSGLLWQLFNAAWLLCWLSIPVSFLLASQRGKAAAEEAAAAAARQQQARQQGPFGGWGSRDSSSDGSRGSGSRGYGNDYGEGPIVEAEWVSLDEGDGSTGSTGSSGSKRP